VQTGSNSVALLRWPRGPRAGPDPSFVRRCLSEGGTDECTLSGRTEPNRARRTQGASEPRQARGAQAQARSEFTGCGRRRQRRVGVGRSTIYRTNEAPLVRQLPSSMTPPRKLASTVPPLRFSPLSAPALTRLRDGCAEKAAGGEAASFAVLERKRSARKLQLTIIPFTQDFPHKSFFYCNRRRRRARALHRYTNAAAPAAAASKAELTQTIRSKPKTRDRPTGHQRTADEG
jgi:hypothetical protein